MRPPPPPVFLDRDGVIIEDKPGYVLALEDVEMLPGAADAVARLTRTGRQVVIVTNQSAVGRGLLSWRTLEAIHGRIRHLVREAGGEIDGVFVCPHTPSAGCSCRKPRPGLLLRASVELAVSLRGAVVIGDQMTDIEAARAADCVGLLVGAAGATAGADRCLPATQSFPDLPSAVDFVVRSHGWSRA